MGTIPVWIKDLIDRNNAQLELADRGVPGLLTHFPLVMRICALLGRPEFLAELTGFVEKHEAAATPAKAPWRNPRLWMQGVLTVFLGFPVEVPPPPRLNRAQTRALKRYNIRLFFVPAIGEARYPARVVKPDWGKYLKQSETLRIPLPGRWVAFDVTRKPDYTDRVYPNDRLAADLGLESRFAHPHSGKGEGDDIVEDLMPKIATLTHFASSQVGLASAEAWNFLASLMNFLRENYGEDLPDLGSTNSVEWVANTHGSGRALVVGRVERGGLAYVSLGWRDYRSGDFGFRPLVTF